MLQGSGHPEAGRLSSLGVAGKGADGGVEKGSEEARSPGRVGGRGPLSSQGMERWRAGSRAGAGAARGLGAA